MKSTRRHIPQRTCVACRQETTKGELVRLVRTTDGSVEVDTSGRKAGRGAYLCRVRECWQLGVNGKRLEHALRITLAQDNREQLIAYGENLPG
ncbi:RNase P modulator RnpM [Chloroflexota bacterium]